MKILRDPKVINFIDIEEISIILNFISHYETLLGQFNMITDKDFIEDGVYNGCQLKESAIVQDNYDCIYIDPDTEKTMLIYTAAYREIDEAKMNMKIKIAEHKAEEIAKELFALYQQIKRWLEYKGQKTINYESIMIVGGRATADFSIYGNQYFK